MAKQCLPNPQKSPQKPQPCPVSSAVSGDARDSASASARTSTSSEAEDSGSSQFSVENFESNDSCTQLWGLWDVDLDAQEIPTMVEKVRFATLQEQLM